MENYIVINGKKTELTDEQLRQLGITPTLPMKNPFERSKHYYITKGSCVSGPFTDRAGETEKDLYDACNYFNDFDFTKQVYLTQLLYRRLLKFTYENNCVDTEPYGYDKYHCFIALDESGEPVVWSTHTIKPSPFPTFSTEEMAQKAIDEVVKPFMEQYYDWKF